MIDIDRPAQNIAHIVSYVSKDGAFGGPVAVAMGQVAELARRGHDVELLAGWDGLETLAIHKARVCLRSVFRVGPGFLGLISVPLWLRVLKKCSSTDIFHIHLGRDPISLFSAVIVTLRKRPFVVQTHGMIMPRGSLAVKLLDFFVTRKVLKSALRVLVLTRTEAEGIQALCRGQANIELIPNGISISAPRRVERNKQRLLFLARLHPRKRVMAFAEMCKLLRDQKINFTAHVVGPDEGDLGRLISYIAEHNLSAQISYEGPIGPGKSLDWLSSSGVFILPSHGEVFPMTILESLAAGTAVVTTSDSGLAPTLLALRAAAVTDGTPEELAASVVKILNDDDYRQSLVQQGFQALDSELGIKAVVSQLEHAYSQ